MKALNFTKYRIYQLLVLGGCVIGLLTMITSVVLAGSASDSWTTNGVSMSGSHNADFIGMLDRYIDASSSGHTPTYGVLDYMDVVGLLEDRCKNQNGTWQTWQTFASNSSAATYTSGVSTYAQGTYQTCSYGHEYRNKSKHQFKYNLHYVNEYHWLCSGESC